MSDALRDDGPPIRDRAEAGRRLAVRLRDLVDATAVVVAIPRGGVPVAVEIAGILGLPLDLLIVRKVGAPGNPEYGLGAVAEGGFRGVDPDRAREAGATEIDLEATMRSEEAEVARRARVYRAGRPPVEVRGRAVVLVDDGVATGGTVATAVRALRARGAARIVVALGVAPPDAVRRLRAEADAVVVERCPSAFHAVSEWYRDFPQLEDEEVLDLLGGARSRAAGRTP